MKRSIRLTEAHVLAIIELLTYICDRHTEFTFNLNDTLLLDSVLPELFEKRQLRTRASVLKEFREMYQYIQAGDQRSFEDYSKRNKDRKTLDALCQVAGEEGGWDEYWKREGEGYQEQWEQLQEELDWAVIQPEKVLPEELRWQVVSGLTSALDCVTHGKDRQAREQLNRVSQLLEELGRGKAR